MKLSIWFPVTRPPVITELRGILFDTLRCLKDESMKLDQAKAINETAGTLIASARAETEMLELIGGRGSGFIPQITGQREAVINGDQPKLPGLAAQAAAAGKTVAA